MTEEAIGWGRPRSGHGGGDLVEADAASVLVRRVDFHRHVVCMLGLPFDVLSLAEAAERIRDAALSRRRCFISTPNLNFVVAARTDSNFRDSVLRSDLSVVDGMPLVWLARAMGLPIRERVPGAGLFEALLGHTGAPVTVYFFGGAAGIAEAACRRVNERAGGLRCVGHDTPGFGSVAQMSDDARIARINASGAQFLIVALGAHKGQAWIEHNAERLQVPVLCHLGAVVNFAAGSLQRAPAWVQKRGLEWLWRIKEEPKLWRRYFGDAVAAAPWMFHALAGAVAPSLRPRGGEAALPALRVTPQPGGVVLELKGAWVSMNLGPLRDALTELSAQACGLSIDVHEVSEIDSAFIGLMLVARGHFGSRRWFEMRKAPRHVLRKLRRFGAEYAVGRAAPAI